MPILTILAASAQAMGVISSIMLGGLTTWTQFKAFLQTNGIESDLSALDAIIDDAERRRTIREHEAEATE